MTNMVSVYLYGKITTVYTITVFPSKSFICCEKNDDCILKIIEFSYVYGPFRKINVGGTRWPYNKNIVFNGDPFNELVYK